MKDLWGNEISESDPNPRSSPHAGIPGTGPDGETCGTCDHHTWRRHGRRRYYKCGHPRARKATAGPGTDIRLKDLACSYWMRSKEQAADDQEAWSSL